MEPGNFPSAGQTISHYRVLERLGGGGMGVVYRAQDLRLERTVALKFLLDLNGANNRRRFLHEAKAASALDHPNICTVYEIDETEEGHLFIAMAYYEGETLKTKIERGPLGLNEALDYAIQIATGLARAHAQGIVHRDVKPANVVVTRDGQVKIVDFGIAKSADRTRLTRDGIAMGTIAYMSPEQLRGTAVDSRTDIWSLGVVLHEMITGRLPFRGDNEQALAYSILSASPEPVTACRTGVPIELDRILAKTMAMDPADRYQHADELPVDLRSLRQSQGTGASTSFQEKTLLELPAPPRASGSRPLPPPAGSVSSAEGVPPRQRRWLAPALCLGGLFLALSLVLLWKPWTGSTGSSSARVSPPVQDSLAFKSLTFDRGTIRSARFAPDGQTILYGAAWKGGPIRIFLTRADSSLSTPLELPPAELLSLSSKGEMAISLGHQFEGALMGSGTLARTPMLGRAPRQILEDVQEADWTPDGSELAIVRRAVTGERLEFPSGRVLYETNGYISHARFSHDGERIAFLDHPTYPDDRGSVAVIDLKGRKATLSDGWASIRGLAWSPSGKEVWFSGTRAGQDFALYAVDLEGRERTLLRAPGSMVLLDVYKDGRVLLTREEQTRQITALLAGEPRERDLSWLDYSMARFLSNDGKTVLITHFGEGSGANYSVYLRPTDGSPGIRLGEGEAMALSPDGKWAASLVHGLPPRVLLLPTGAGTAQTLKSEVPISAARWFPDGRRFLLVSQRPGVGARCYVQEAGGRPAAITPAGVRTDPWLPISPDGRFIAATSPEGTPQLYPVAGGKPKAIPALEKGEQPLRWGATDEVLFVSQSNRLPVKVYRIDLTTGKRQLWREIMPSDPAGIIRLSWVLLTPDGRTCVFNSTRLLSHLYLVEGLR